MRGWRGHDAQALQADLLAHDALVIATATDVRLPLLRAAVAAGQPVYVEKPLAFRPADLAEIARITTPIAQRSMLGYMMRYHPALQALAGRDLADIFHFSFAIGHDVNAWRQNWRFADSYAARAEGGGVLLDLCHEIDMAHCLFPDLQVERVVSQGHARFPGVDMASRLMLTAPGRSGSVAMDYLTPRLHRRAILMGSRQMVDFDFAAERYAITDASGTAHPDLPLERDAMFLAAMRDFLTLVAGHTPANPLAPRLDRALPSAHLVAAAWAARRFIGPIAKEFA